MWHVVFYFPSLQGMFCIQYVCIQCSLPPHQIMCVKLQHLNCLRPQPSVPRTPSTPHFTYKYTHLAPLWTPLLYCCHDCHISNLWPWWVRYTHSCMHNISQVWKKWTQRGPSVWHYALASTVLTTSPSLDFAVCVRARVCVWYDPTCISVFLSQSFIGPSYLTALIKEICVRVCL